MPARSIGETPVFHDVDDTMVSVTDAATGAQQVESATQWVPMGALPMENVDVVVSGISCRLPQSESIEEFKNNLMQGVDMVTEDELRWIPGRSFLVCKHDLI